MDNKIIYESYIYLDIINICNLNETIMKCEQVMKYSKIMIMLFIFLMLPFMVAEDESSPVVVPLHKWNRRGMDNSTTPLVFQILNKKDLKTQ